MFNRPKAFDVPFRLSFADLGACFTPCLAPLPITTLGLGQC
ncbi:hypothetical protein [Bacillus toyonensis]|nr:hypothetical protein [Bacillus toyonensis]